MANPTYKVQIDDDGEEKVFEDIDISKKAEEIASEKISELKKDISSALGNETKKGYANFDEMQADIDRRAEEKAKTYTEKAKEEIRNELKEKEESAKKERDAEAAQTVEQQKKEWAQMTEEWKEAVSDGIAPSINQDLSKRLSEGAKWEDLSEEDKKDPGLVFYNEARKRHAELKKEGKANSFYRTIAKYGEKPAGATAPVFGGGVGVQAEDDDFTYDELHEATREQLGVG